jgi:hypothetical protein
MDAVEITKIAYPCWEANPACPACRYPGSLEDFIINVIYILGLKYF